MQCTMHRQCTVCIPYTVWKHFTQGIVYEVHCLQAEHSVEAVHSVYCVYAVLCVQVEQCACSALCTGSV